ncbi:MAG: tetratricopeptide repeat protein [Spirobacillus cienkowskii]|jgi:hypothetical protein|uniref:Tetratricopeptide repeat protein n=1 Tax=Spirobacillus cienkowskii TaxID=495820 RepID=A0A369KPD8_9BACT|nr:MAG: tetratricopeptide repeat protein [Spirobacillus cienkowskii]
MTRNLLAFFVVLLLVPFGMLACTQQNIFSSSIVSLQNLAKADMEQGRYSDAQTKLQQEIAANPTNYIAVSLLAACYAAQGNIILYQILVVKVFSLNADPNTNPIGFAKLLLPTPTATVLTQNALANSTMDLIPVLNKTSDMQFQHYMFASVYLFLQIIDAVNILQGGGVVAPAQLTQILNSLNYANSLSNGSGNFIVSALSALTNGIQNSPGATQEDKLANYLLLFV